MNNKQNLKSKKQYLLQLNTTVAISINKNLYMHAQFCGMLITTAVEKNSSPNKLLQTT